MAVLGRVFLGEPVPARTWAAIAGALVGIVLTVGGAVAGPRPGDLFAGATVLCMAAYLTTVRSAGVPWLLLLCLGVIPLSFSLITLAPRYLPAHEVALIGLLEMVLGPYLIWWVLGERPGSAALAGGAVVLAVLVAHSLAALRAGARVNGRRG